MILKRTTGDGGVTFEADWQSSPTFRIAIVACFDVALLIKKRDQPIHGDASITVYEGDCLGAV